MASLGQRLAKRLRCRVASEALFAKMKTTSLMDASIIRYFLRVTFHSHQSHLAHLNLFDMRLNFAWKVQFYCAPPGKYTMSPRLYTRHVKIAIEQVDVIKEESKFSLLQKEFLKSTLPPIQPIALPEWGGEEAMQGRGKCAQGGPDRCPTACGGSCQCKAGWGGDDCSTFMLRMSQLGDSTDERGTDGPLVQVIVGALVQPCEQSPSPCDVVCDVSVTNAQEGRFVKISTSTKDGVQLEVRELVASVQVTISGQYFDEATGGSTGPAFVAGWKDFLDDGDQPFDVLVGPCASEDPRYNGISQNMYPEETSLSVTNKHHPYPMITKIFPDITHINGRQITVTGQQILFNSTVLYGGVKVSEYGNDRAENAYTWRHFNITNIDYPLTLNESRIVDPLLACRACDVLVTEEIQALEGPNSSSTIGELVSADVLLLQMFGQGRLNRLLCDVQDVTDESDRSGLFDFRWVRDREGAGGGEGRMERGSGRRRGKGTVSLASTTNQHQCRHQ